MSKEKLIEQIMRECAEDGEPVTFKEAEEMAEMELKAKGNRHYEKSAKERKPATRERKLDEEKVEIIKKIYEYLLTNGEESATIVNEQKEITFREFSITLTKHRPKKGE